METYSDKLRKLADLLDTNFRDNIGYVVKELTDILINLLKRL